MQVHGDGATESRVQGEDNAELGDFGVKDHAVALKDNAVVLDQEVLEPVGGEGDHGSPHGLSFQDLADHNHHPGHGVQVVLAVLGVPFQAIG